MSSILRFALGAVGIAIGLLGCRGPSAEGGNSGPAPSSSVKAALQAPRGHLRIGHLPITDHLTVIAKSRQSLPNVDLELVKLGSWPEIAEALRAGALDGAFLLSPIAFNLRQKGAPIKAVLLGHRNGSVVVVRNSPELSSVESLKGKKIAIPSRFSTHNILIHKIFRDHGLDVDKDAQLLELKPPEMVNALATGQIDAFIVAEPFGGQAELQKVGKVLALSKDIWPEHICCVLNIRESVIAAQRDAVQETVNAFVEAGHFAEEHASEAAALSTAYLGQKKEVVEYVLTNPKGRVRFNNLLPQASDFTETQRYLKEFAIASEGPDVATYLDDSFARRAYGVAPQ